MDYLNRKIEVKIVLCCLLVSICAIFLVFGFLGYEGSRGYYLMFSATFFVMLASGFYKKVTYGYLFLVVFFLRF